jgi:hypothetical protein
MEFSRISIVVDDFLRRSGVTSIVKEESIVKEQDLNKMKDGSF